MHCSKYLSPFVFASLCLTTYAAEAGTAKATFYANKFVGRRTASGEVYSHGKMTAAHGSLPFGTRVRVTNPATGRSVCVKVNDRGVHGAHFDLSQGAARAIGVSSSRVSTDIGGC